MFRLHFYGGFISFYDRDRYLLFEKGWKKLLARILMRENFTVSNFGRGVILCIQKKS